METAQPGLGQLVRSARQKARLSRDQLARLSGLSSSTLKNLETGRHVASTTTLKNLIAVQELGIPPDALAGLAAPPEGRLNAWIAPGFNPIEMYRQMVMVLSGAGGHLEQTFAYFDHGSAADWCAISSQEDYAAAHASMPLDQEAEAISAQVGGAGVDIVALGPGDGRLDTRLAVQVAQRLRNPVGRFFLLDISQPLLGASCQHAIDTLAGSFPGISAIAIQGDFHRMPQYSQLLYVPPGVPRRQLVCMLGGTFSNLDNELRFIRDSLCGFGPGAMLLLDYPCVFGESEEEIRRRDPWLNERSALRWRSKVGEFLTGPLRRYCPGAQEIRLSPELVTRGLTIDKSYAVEVHARVMGPGKPDRLFSVFRLKRYTTATVIQSLQALGWAHMSGVRYGAEVGYERTLSLFMRRT